MPSMKLHLTILASAIMTLAISAHAAAVSEETRQISEVPIKNLEESFTRKFGATTPLQWGENVTGVITGGSGAAKKIALTMDACGGHKGMGIDMELITFLEREKIPATLFLNARWIDGNMALFEKLASNPLFEIANHGFAHKPASVNGEKAYGISGTRNVSELVDEIELNARKIGRLTGKRPAFYRSGTAFYDEVAVKVANRLGQKVAGFNILGDAGATFSREKVKEAILSAKPGAIIIIHMNHPEAETGKGAISALPELIRRGYRFVKLSEMEMQ